ncbi:unnamed protein product [marine sediment metagenome]|uniref:Uncharacterized protein n=1 Tax=marine sediment metagenome TaxID=412755 RepID=X0Y3R6_9ZZZZ
MVPETDAGHRSPRYMANGGALTAVVARPPVGRAGFQKDAQTGPRATCGVARPAQKGSITDATGKSETEKGKGR